MRAPLHFAQFACAALLISGLVCSSALAQEEAENKADPAAPVSFEKDVAPILVQKCLACHGEKQPKGGYQLHTFASLMKPGDSESAPVTGGDTDDSYLYYLISETDKDVWMPKEGDRLSDEQIATVQRWIKEGAKFDGDKSATLVSLVPRVYDAAPEAYRVPAPVTAVALNPEGTELAAGGYNEITVWNPADGKLLRRIGQIAQRTYDLAFSADGKLLAAASGTPGTTGEIKLLDPASGKTVKLLSTMSDVAFGVEFSPKGDKLAACGADRSIRIFDVASGNEDLVIEDHADWVMGIGWSADGAKLASASRDKTAKVFDAKTGESQATYNGHGNTVFDAAFSPDGKQVLTAGADRKIHIWNPADGKKAAEIAGFGNEVYQVFIEGDNVFSCSADKTARQHGLAKRNQVRSYGGHADFVFDVTYSEKAKRLATGTFNGDVFVFNTEDGAQVSKFVPAPGYPPAEQAAK